MYGAKNEGTFGEPYGYTDVMKFLMLGGASIGPMWIATTEIIETVDNLIEWHDQWDNDERSEGITK